MPSPFVYLYVFPTIPTSPDSGLTSRCGWIAKANPPPVHNGGPCVWDVYGVARPGSGQCPALPAARSGLCSTGSHGHRTNPSLPFPVMDPSSFQPPFPPLVSVWLHSKNGPMGPPVRLYMELILSSPPSSLDGRTLFLLLFPLN